MKIIYVTVSFPFGAGEAFLIPELHELVDRVTRFSLFLYRPGGGSSIPMLGIGRMRAAGPSPLARHFARRGDRVRPTFPHGSKDDSPVDDGAPKSGAAASMPP